MVEISRIDKLKPLAEAREKATNDFVGKFPSDLHTLVSEYRQLQLKQNTHRRYVKAVELGTVHEDIKGGAGFVYEGVEALSTEDEARMRQLERVEEIHDYFAKENDFRRKLFKQEDMSFVKATKKKR